MDPVWEAVSRLERKGFKVMALTCDGASANRQLWKIHSQERAMVLYCKKYLLQMVVTYILSLILHIFSKQSETVGQTIRGIFT